MSDLESLELSIRTQAVLSKCGVETKAMLRELHLFALLGAGAGHLVVREAREAQLKLAGSQAPVVVPLGSVTGAPFGTFDTAPLEAAGWKPDGTPGDWKQFLPKAKALNTLKGFTATAAAVRLTINQYDDEADGDVGCELVLVPISAQALVAALATLGESLQWVTKRSEVIAALTPVIAKSALVTREDAPGEKALLPLEAPH